MSLRLTTPARRTFAALCAVGCLTLAACGGEATVEHSDATGAPEVSTSAADKNDKDKDKDKGKESTSETTSQKSDSHRTADESEGDLGAREVDEVPTGAPAADPAEADYLKVLDEKGIRTADDADQLVGLARTVCAEDNEDGGRVTAEAVAGQLVEQRKTELSQQDAAQLLVDTARAEYC
ncbi:DUF732 domain-containing protein [Corynebacterium frankenforstense]